MRARWIVVMVAVLLVVAGCSSDDDEPNATTTTTTSSSTTTSTTTTTAPTTSTTQFEGGTEPVTMPMATERTTLLTDVTVEHTDGVDRIVFRFRDAGLPGIDARYIDKPRAAGSGDPVAVEGDAYLEVRMEPAATADLTGEDAERTYTGPDRVRSDDTTTVTEVVRTGDFEANLTWVIGMRSEARFRVSTETSPSQVIVEVAGT